MGRDKAEICYHQQPQWQALRRLLAEFCDKTFFSCTETQKNKWGLGDQGLIDKIPGHGPASGLQTAFTFYPEVAWLAVGCDYPFLESRDIHQLLESREENVHAVSYFNKSNSRIIRLLWKLICLFFVAKNIIK